MPTSKGYATADDKVRGRRRFLISNFFGGVLQRGIPIYVQNLRIALEQEGITCREVRCPAMLRRLPHPWLGLLFITWEQLVMPVLSLGYDHAFYPYNSTSILDSVTGKSVLVVHDFIPNSRRNTKVLANYIRTVQRIHAWFGRDVIYVSRSTARIGKRSGRFPRSLTYLFPNSFYQFMKHVSDEPQARADAILLCSGWGKNKNLEGALRLYLESKLYRSRRLRILGLAGRRAVVEEFERAHAEVAGRIDVLGQVDDRTVVDAYQRAAWVWVHSLAEGYGRSIAEARICGSKVIATSIAPFREQADDATFLYRGLEQFQRAVANCEAMSGPVTRRPPPEHEILQSEIRRFMSANGQ